jgi:hypothetical protein
MRRITNAKAVELGDKASYKDGSKPKTLIKAEDSLKEVKNAIQKLTEQIGVDITSSNADTLRACDTIVESMDLYHKAIILSVQSVSDSIDTQKLNIISGRIVTIMQMLSKPKEWNFEIERDMMGEMTNVNAKEVTH